MTETRYFNSLDFCQICKTNYHYATLGASVLIPLLIDKNVLVFYLFVFIVFFINCGDKVPIYCYYTYVISVYINA